MISLHPQQEQIRRPVWNPVGTFFDDILPYTMVERQGCAPVPRLPVFWNPLLLSFGALQGRATAWLCFFALCHCMLSATSAWAQIPGTVDITKEFPEFTRELTEERAEMMDFEVSRTVSVSGHLGFDLLLGGLSRTQSNHFAFGLSLDYFVHTQLALSLTGGIASASLAVSGLQDYVGTDGVSRTRQPLSYRGTVSLYPVYIGLRYYLGHPAYPNLFTFLGLNIELLSGVLIRREAYTLLTTGPSHPGLKFFSDISPILGFQTGVEFPILPNRLYLGFRGGYVLALLTDEGQRGYVGEARDGDWMALSSYLMVRLD